jgi:hypothetical protein
LSVRVRIAEHHLIALLPVAAIVIACAGATLARNRLGAAVVICAATVYLGSAIYWQIGAVEGLARTGGIGMWSDGIYRLADGLARNYPGRAIVTPDWGLAYNVYVLSAARVRMSERYEGAGSVAETERLWTEAVGHGGVFVLNAPDHRYFPEPSRAFVTAARASRVSVRKFTVTQRDGREFAEVFEVGVGSAEHVTQETGRGSIPVAASISTSITTNDERSSAQLRGFYEIEGGKWRWTQPQFAITLGRPDSPWNSTARLSVHLYVPEILIQRLGRFTLSARLNEHAFPPETIARSGDVDFVRAVPVEWLSDANTFQFSLSKSLPPSASDRRELGVIVREASLEQ